MFKLTIRLVLVLLLTVVLLSCHQSFAADVEEKVEASETPDAEKAATTAEECDNPDKPRLISLEELEK